MLYLLESLIHRLLDFVVFLSYLRRTRSRTAATALQRVGVSRGSFGFDPKHNVLFLNDLAVSINFAKQAWLLDCLPFMTRLSRSQHATFSALPVENQIRVTLSDITVDICSPGNLLALCEVFDDQVYNINLPAGTVVCDIGMNIGFASLYFAKNPNVQVVYGYEPLKPTYDQAIANFALNSQFASKLRPHNCAVGCRDRTATVAYSKEAQGRIGLQGIRLHHLDSEPTRSETIEVRSIEHILSQIKQEWSNFPLVLKVDCEGSEYEIVHTLEKGGYLPTITAIMMEWHDKGPLEIVEALLKKRFVVFALNEDRAARTGMLYAVNSNSFSSHV